MKLLLILLSLSACQGVEVSPVDVASCNQMKELSRRNLLPVNVDEQNELRKKLTVEIYQAVYTAHINENDVVLPYCQY